MLLRSLSQQALTRLLRSYSQKKSLWKKIAAIGPDPCCRRIRSWTRRRIVDVAVIGGGFTELSAAYYLRSKRPLRSVLLLEARRCGNGASARNGAMLLTLTEDRYMQAGSDFALDKKSTI